MPAHEGLLADSLLDDTGKALSEDSDTETTKHGYDDGEYWDNRYKDWASDPYDWLVEFKDMEVFIGKLFDPSEEILCPGCGNAPFHPDMYDAGWTKQICLDTSKVVIDQSIERMSETHPDMVFFVADCTDLAAQDNSYSCILDKSLIDTLRCEAGSYAICEKFIGEMYRVLQPGGIFITVSLNTYNDQDIAQYYIRDHWKWTVAYGSIRNPSFEKAKDNTEHYTAIVCTKKEDDQSLQPLVKELIAQSEARYEFDAHGKLVLKA
jgi:ubiquinone/menaquinone biosynthesis C-methylase UbiE